MQGDDQTQAEQDTRQFYIPTTRKPVRILKIAEEADTSTVCINFSHRQAGVSNGYHSFVKRPTGVIHRLFASEPYPFYRMDVSDGVDAGESWELAVFLAHAQMANGAAGPNDLIWATATVSHDLRVGAVASVSEKIRLSEDLFEDARGDGRRVLVVMSKENEGDIEADAKDIFRRFGITPSFVSRVDEALALLGLPTVEAKASSRPPIKDKWQGNPYRGLQPFEYAHRAVFFGRSRAVEEASNKLRTAAARGVPLLMVHGPSGVGKSSFVRAGLVGAIVDSASEEGAIPFRVLSPRAAVTPLAALLDALGSMLSDATGTHTTLLNVAEATAAIGTRTYADTVSDRPAMLLVIDQFEEVLDSTMNPEEVAAFDEALVAAIGTGRAWVVATIRSDALGQFGRLASLSALTTDDRLYRLETPRRSELASIIRDPAANAGLRFEDPSIVDDLADVAFRSPDSLPLLQAALYRLFDFARSEGTLTRRTLDIVGGFEGAIARWADEAHAEIVAAGFRAEDIDGALASLVRIDPDARATLSRVQPLVAGTLAFEVLSALVERRLATRFEGADVPRVRLAHEALTTHWPRMAGLVRRLSSEMAVRDDLELRVAAWEKSGRDGSELIRGAARLDAAEGFVREGRLPVPQAMADYVAASTSAAAAERRREEEAVAVKLAAAAYKAESAEVGKRAAESAARASKRLSRILAASVAIFAATAGTAGYFWYESLRNGALAATERDQKEKQLKLAEANQTRFLARAAFARVETDPELGRAMMLERIPEGTDFGGEKQPEMHEAETALRRIKELDPVQVSFAAYSDKAPQWSPDGKRLAFVEVGKLSIWDAATGAPIDEFGFAKGSYNEGTFKVSWAPSSDRLLVQFVDAEAAVIDLAERKVTRIPDTAGFLLATTSDSPWSPDGKFLALPDSQGFMSLWSAPDLAHVALVKPRINMASAYWASDSKSLLYMEEQRVWAFDIATRSTKGSWPSPGGKLKRLLPRPKGPNFLTTSDDGSIALWDGVTDRPTQVITNLSSEVGQSDVRAAWSSNGEFIAAWVAEGDFGSPIDKIFWWSYDGETAKPSGTQIQPPFGEDIVDVHVADDFALIVETDKSILLHGYPGLPITERVDKVAVGKSGVAVHRDGNGGVLMAIASDDQPAVVFGFLGNSFNSPIDAERAKSLKSLNDEERNEYGLVRGTTEDPARLSEKPADRCDAAAQHPYDTNGAGYGISYSAIVSETAVPACKAATVANPGNARSHYQLGRSLLKAGRDAEALQAISRSSDMGYAIGMARLADAYANGEGTDVDQPRARQLVAEALRLGAPNAAGPLGQMEWEGIGGPASPTEAVATWKRGAALGDGVAHYKLGWVAELGRDGTPAELSAALFHYAVATEIFERIGEGPWAAAARLRRGSLARSMNSFEVAAIWAKSREFVRRLPGRSDMLN